MLMKSKQVQKPPRNYEQKARALAAEATGLRILDAFLKRIEAQWFEEITLDVIAREAGVTVQTVVRRFGSKAGLLEAARDHLHNAVQVRRAVRPGDVARTVTVLAEDYEAVGDLVLRLLGQEERHPILKPVVDQGRRGHRDWLATVFVQALARLTPARREAVLDALVVATDIYVWKLVRRDMGRSVSAFKTIVKTLLNAALHSVDSAPPTQS